MKLHGTEKAGRGQPEQIGSADSDRVDGERTLNVLKQLLLLLRELDRRRHSTTQPSNAREHASTR